MADIWGVAALLREMGRVWKVHDHASRVTQHAVREWSRGGARRRCGAEVTVLVRCRRCDVVLDTLHGRPDEGSSMRSVGRGEHIDAFAGSGRPTHGGLLRREDVEGLLRSAELRRYRCPQPRCPGDYLVKWERLTAAFRVAAAARDRRHRVIRLPIE